MALTSEVLVLSTVDQPSGYTPPTAALTLTDPQRKTETINTAASAIENANPVTGLTALVAAIKTAGDALLTAYGVDVTANTVVAQYTMKTTSRVHGVSIYSTTDDILSRVDVAWDKTA